MLAFQTSAGSEFNLVRVISTFANSEKKIEPEHDDIRISDEGGWQGLA